jgi:hypothetical protein
VSELRHGLASSNRTYLRRAVSAWIQKQGKAMSKPKYKVGDVLTVDIGWDRQILRKITISEVSANHVANRAYRYWGVDEHRHLHGFYEDQIGTNSSVAWAGLESPL